MIDQILLNDTLQKINASLNKRFEKNSDLYISKQDEYEIKKNLCNKSYGGIVDMAKAKGISNDIIVKVIMRNAGILNVRNSEKFRKELRPILDNADYSVLKYMMEDILKNCVYVQKEIKAVLFEKYMKGISDQARIDYWRNDEYTFDITERTELFNRIIENTDFKDTMQNLNFKISFMKDAFKKYPWLMKSYEYIKLKNTLDESGAKVFFDFLCREMRSPYIDDDSYRFVVMSAYSSYGESAFNDAVSWIKDSSPTNYKQYIRVIRKLIEKEKDEDTLVRMFDTIYRVHESPYIKNHIKREINKKIWNTAKSNDVLYAARKAVIDNILAQTEQADKKEYTSFSDVNDDLLAGTRPKSVGYNWINMKSPEFEQSILDSFKETSPINLMCDTYSSLFEHSLAKGNIRELKKLCEHLAKPLHEFDSSNDGFELFDTLDQLWLENVIKYKFQSKEIKEYVCEKHFDRVKELE